MPNRLAGETSPYLLQHADNPVDWYPWGDEALARARREDRPILLSIGYSACHWCHVMAHESFEDAATAAVMNGYFVNIKVDREERPDLDQVYQLAHQLLQQRPGGWPLTLFLTPDGTPFFSGTYFPKISRHGLPAFVGVLEQVARIYVVQRGDIEAQNAAVRRALQLALSGPAAAGEPLDAAPLTAAADALAEAFDVRWGGFGDAPKFPRQSELALLLRLDTASRERALHTLRAMAAGGLYDHLGGGFYRYSVDARWEIPHFEKMLYDNGLLLALYADAWALASEPLFAQVVDETAAWVMREMQSAEGGYCSSQDADAGGEEGRYYLWTPADVAALLTPAEYRVAALHYGLDQPANFEGRAWHLHAAVPLADACRRLDLSLADGAGQIASARAKLFAARQRRGAAGRDDKVLAGWNGLMIAGMARAARAFGRDDWLASAQRAFDFVRSALWRDSRLLATCRAGRAHLNAYLDDHAFLVDAALALLQAAWRPQDLAFATALADALLARYAHSAGGFHFTADDHEALILRPRSGHDDATPSGNGVAARALLRLGLLTGNAAYQTAAERTLAAFWPQLQAQPADHASLLTALADALSLPETVVLRGPAADLPEWQRALGRRFLPQILSFALPNGCPGLPPPLAKPESAEVNAWRCTGVNCQAPVASLEILMCTVFKAGNVE